MKPLLSWFGGEEYENGDVEDKAGLSNGHYGFGLFG